MSDIAAGLCVDATFATFGKAATYTPPGGIAADCTVIKTAQDRELNMGGFGKPIIEGVVIEVRASEVASPVKDGTFTVDEVAYLVTSDPETKDSERLVWRCTVR